MIGEQIPSLNTAGASWLGHPKLIPGGSRKTIRVPDRLAIISIVHIRLGSVVVCLALLGLPAGFYLVGTAQAQYSVKARTVDEGLPQNSPAISVNTVVYERQDGGTNIRDIIAVTLEGPSALPPIRTRHLTDKGRIPVPILTTGTVDDTTVDPTINRTNNLRAAQAALSSNGDSAS